MISVLTNDILVEVRLCRYSMWLQYSDCCTITLYIVRVLVVFAHRVACPHITLTPSALRQERRGWTTHNGQRSELIRIAGKSDRENFKTLQRTFCL